MYWHLFWVAKKLIFLKSKIVKELEDCIVKGKPKTSTQQDRLLEGRVYAVFLGSWISLFYSITISSQSSKDVAKTYTGKTDELEQFR